MKRALDRALRIFVVFGVLATLLAAVAPGAQAAGPTQAPDLVTPLQGEGVNANPVLDWSPVAGATRYHVEVSTTSSFATTVYQTDTYNTSATPHVDLPVGVLYWSVAGMEGTSLGPASVGTFEKIALNAPAQLTPLDGAELTYPNDPPLFSWNPLPGMKEYVVEIDDEDGFVNPEVNTTTKNTSLTLVESQTVNQTYYWRVRGISSGGVNTHWSPVRTYTMRWPNAPVLVKPVDGIDVHVEDVVFEWEPVPGASTYEIEISHNGDWAQTPAHKKIVKSTRYSPPIIDSLNNASYYWRVRALDGRSGTPNYGPWSEERQFRRAWPQQPQLTSPADQNYAFTSLEFAWTPVKHASHYEIQMSTDENFSPGSLITKSCYTNHTEWTPLDIHSGENTGLPGTCPIYSDKWPLMGTTMYWRVRAIDDPKGILGLWSEQRSFKYIIPAPNVTGPVDGVTTERPVLTWEDVPGASHYLVTIKNNAGSNVGVPVKTYGLSYTPTMDLQPSAGPYKWYVQAVDHDNRVGLAPNAANYGSFQTVKDCPEPAGTCVQAFPVYGSPVPLTPAENVTSPVMPSLTWQPVDNATHYVVMYGTQGSNVESQLNPTNLHFSGYTHPEILQAGTYFWYVMAYKSGTLLSVGPQSTFTVQPLPPATPVGPTDCADPATCVPIADTPTLDWAPVPGAGVYLVYLARDASFTNVVKVYKTQTTQLTPRESLLDSQAGQAYFWFVRACEYVDTSSSRCGPFNNNVFDQAFAFRKNSAPVEVTAPADGAVVQNQVTFSWKDFIETNQNLANPVAQEAEAYRLQVSTKSDFSTLVETVTVDQTTYTPHDKTYPEGPLYWRVQAIDGSGNTLTQSPARLVTKATPAIQMDYPAQGATVDAIPHFRWSPQNFATKYEIEVAKNADTTFSATNRVLMPTGNLVPKVGAWASTSALPDGTYAWRIRRLDADGKPGVWSTTRTFTVAAGAPALLAPVDGKLSKSHDVVFQWGQVQGAASYKFELSTNSAFTGAPFETMTTAMQAWAPTKLIPDGKYYWRVRPVDGGGNVGTPSAVRTWTKDINGPDTRLLAPVPAGTLRTTAATFTFDSLEPGATFECSLDNAAWQGCSSPKTYKKLSQGSHKFEVRGVDGAGNADATPATAHWVVSTVDISKIVYEAKTTNGEYVVISNATGTPVPLNGWKLVTSKKAAFTFPTYTLPGKGKVKVHTGRGSNTATDLYWGRSTPAWNNTSDTATLKRKDGTAADACSYNSSYSSYIDCP